MCHRSPTKEKFQIILRNFDERNQENILESLKSINFTLQNKNSSQNIIKELIEANLHEKLIKYLDNNFSDSIHFEVSLIFSQIETESENDIKILLQLRLLPKLIYLFTTSKVENVLNQLLLAFLNLSNCPLVRILLLHLDILKHILFTMNSITKTSILRGITSFLNIFITFCKEKLLNESQNLLNIFTKLINENDSKICENLLLAIASFIEINQSTIQMIIDSNLLKKIVEFLHSENEKVVLASLQVIGNLLSGNENQTNTILSYGVLSMFIKLLESPIQKHLLFWCISNITSGTPKQLQMVINSGIFPKIIDFSKKCTDILTKSQILWVISCSFNSPTTKQIEYLFSCECIDILFSDKSYSSLNHILTILSRSIDSESEDVVFSEIKKKGGIQYLEKFLETTREKREYESIEQFLNELKDWE